MQSLTALLNLVNKEPLMGLVSALGLLRSQRWQTVDHFRVYQ